jgi:mannose/fructose/N-acetylgalactosamine-specific phosphotransferase system component IIC
MMRDNTTERQAQAEIKGIVPGGKSSSRAAQIFAATWIIALTILKAVEFIKLEIDEIIYSGFAIAGVFIPCYFSIWLDKIRDIRFGKN